MIGKTTFFLDSLGLVVSVKISAPESLESQVFKSVLHYFARGFGNEPLSPEGHSYPIANFSLGIRDSYVAGRSNHKSNAPDRMTEFF